MSYRMEGEISIPLDEFWEYVEKYGPKVLGERRYGVPRVDPENPYDMIITFVENTECCPDDEVGENIAKAEWRALKESTTADMSRPEKRMIRLETDGCNTRGAQVKG